MYIDIHCHLTGDHYDSIDALLARARERDVKRIVCSAYDLDSAYASAELAELYEEVYFCVGFHPSELDKYQDGDLDKLRTLCEHEKCIAVGEIGLDYHFEDNPSPEKQREFFYRQLVLADEVGLPVVLHSRDAAQETLEFLQTYKSLLKKGGLMHCYSYSPEMSDLFAELGLYFSFGGTSTFKNARKVQESVQRIPAHRILSETDSPYLTPVPFRGTFPNEPKNVEFVTQTLASLRGVSVREMQDQIMENAKNLFFKLK